MSQSVQKGSALKLLKQCRGGLGVMRAVVILQLTQCQHISSKHVIQQVFWCSVYFLSLR